MPDYNPYDLVQVSINGELLYARPVEFSSDIVDNNKMTNAFGAIVKPVKIAVTCPKCGSGLIVDVSLPHPPFGVCSLACVVCEPPLEKMEDPFINPVRSKTISLNDYDKSMHNFRDSIIGETVVEAVVTDIETDIDEILEESDNGFVDDDLVEP
jgi:hypothetical protein